MSTTLTNSLERHFGELFSRVPTDTLITFFSADRSFFLSFPFPPEKDEELIPGRIGAKRRIYPSSTSLLSRPDSLQNLPNGPFTCDIRSGSGYSKSR